MTSATSAAYEINQVYINPWKCDVKSISVAIVQIFILFMKRIRVEIVRKCGEGGRGSQINVFTKFSIVIVESTEFNDKIGVNSRVREQRACIHV